MARMRVYELAKELGRDNKEIQDYLTSKGVNVVSHMTWVEDSDVQMVRANVPKAAPKPAAPKAGEGTAERPKKKNISRVFHGQNSLTGIQRPQSMRQDAGRGAAQKRAPQPAAKPAKPVQTAAPEKPKTVEAVKQPAQAPSPAPVKPEESVKSTAPVQAAAPAKAQERVQTKTEGQTRNTAARQDGERRSYNNSQNGERRSYNNNQSGERRSYNNQNGERRSYNNQNGERRSYNNQDGERRSYNNQNGERRSYNNNQNGERRSYNNQNGERRSYNNQDGERRSYNNQNGERRSYNNQNGERRTYNNQNGERKPFDRDNRGYNSDRRNGFADKDGDNNSRDQRSGRTASRSTARTGMGSADMGSKPVTKESRFRNDKDKDKDKYSKHDKFDREEKPQGRSGQKNNSQKNDKKAGKFIKPVKPAAPVQKKEDEERVITLPDTMTIRELADVLKIQAAAIVKKLFMQGKIVTVNHEIDFDTAEEIALEYNCIAEHEEKVDVIGELLKDIEDPEDTLKERPPVVCVMGHVDHGKTSLLDAIRNTHVIAKEAGGITQHIGAYTVNVNGQKITFLDTPGHEAFTAMRMRGANSTDIAILVVAADDGVMPQTIEAINHAKAAGVEVIVAINKIDKPAANLDRVKKELAEHELIPEDWGGSTVCVPVSAHTQEGIDSLLEMVLLTAEVLELKANPDRKARGLIIEAQLDKGKGPVATVLVQKGTLHVGDIVAVGSCYGKVRAMMDDKGRRVKEAGPSTPVEILGLSDVPGAGDVFVACENEKEARSFAETFISEGKERLLEETKAKMSLDDLFTQIQAGNLKELNLIVKADVQGSVEAVKQSLTKLSNEEVVVKVIHSAAGAVNESDVSLASASNAIIIGFNTRIDPGAKLTAEQENVDIRLYRVIYDAINDVEHAMKGMLDPIYEEKIIGHGEVRQIFKASGVGTIAGSYVLDGVFQRNCSVRITREGKQIFEGALASLKRFKDDVKEVRAGYECGLVFEKFNDVKEFDLVEAYTMVEVPR